MAALPLVVAHRGLHTTGQIENTFLAFQAAVEAGADMIEFDVRRTKAGELVILHDHKLKGVSLDKFSLDEFEAKTGFRPPLLQEVLDWAAGLVALDVELKEEGYVADVVPLLERFKEQRGELIVTSFLESVLVEMSQLAPSIDTGLLMMFTAQQAAERTIAANAKIALPEMKTMSEAVIESLVGGGLDLIVWDYMIERSGPELLTDERIRAVITDDVLGAVASRS